MTRPTRITVNNGDISWESQLNTNLQQLYDTPIPILLHAGTLANLETTRPAAQFQWCMAIVDYDSAGTPGQHLAFSNGTAWKLVSNWEFFSRRTFRAITGAITVADIDDSILITGSSTFDLTMPAITDANEGRVIRVKHNGTGTVTVKTTGGDTIDGAATKELDTQFDAFEFISDGTSEWQIFGASGGGGLFTELTDTPADYTGHAQKAVVVNSAEDAIEFVSLANVLGNQLKHNSRGQVAADADQTLVAFPGANILMPTQHSAAGSAVTWDAVNDWFLINEDGTYLLTYQVVTEDGSAHNVYSILQKDVGAGFIKIESSRAVNGLAVANSNAGHAVEALVVGDKVQLWAADLSSVSPVAREGTGLSIIKLEASIAGGGDLEVFERSRTTNLALGPTPAAIDLPNAEEDNATDLWTWSTGTDDLTVNEAGVYLISAGVTFEEAGLDIDAVMALQIDTGSGFATKSATQRSIQGTANLLSNIPAAFTTVVTLAATDKIRLAAWEVDGAVELRVGCNLMVTRLKRGSESIDFSTTEQKTGRKWIDGKDVYRKIVSFSALGNAVAVTQAHNITGLDSLVSLEGTARDAGATRFSLPFVHLTLASQVKMFIDATNVTIDTGVDRSDHTAEVLIEYTKT